MRTSSRWQQPGRPITVDQRVKERNVRTAARHELCAGDRRLDGASAPVGLFGSDDVRSQKKFAKPRHVDVRDSLNLHPNI